MTKGVMALLTGIAVDKGAVKNIDEKVMAFFPDYEVKRGEKTIYDVTIRHLLTMTAPYKGKSEPWKKVCTSDTSFRRNTSTRYTMVAAGLGLACTNTIIGESFTEGVRYMPLSPKQPVEIGITVPGKKKMSPAARRFAVFARERYY